MNRLLISALALTLLACGQGEPEAASASDQAPPPTPPAASSPQASPPASDPGGVGMLSSRGSQTGTAPAARSGNSDRAVMAAGLQFVMPEGWQRQQPSSNMRLAQAAIPGSAGEGLLTVFFFGPGGGGGVDANLDRWAGQIEGGEPQRDAFEANGLRITWIEKTGTLQPSGFGMGPTEPVPNSRLIGAVIEGPGGPWFFKATGPDQTLADQRDAFVTMLREARLTA